MSDLIHDLLKLILTSLSNFIQGYIQKYPRLPNIALEESFKFFLCDVLSGGTPNLLFLLLPGI